MKKIITSILCIFLLTSCFGGSDSGGQGDTEKKAGLVIHNGAGYSMQIPASWTLLEESSEALPLPKKGSIELAVTSTDSVENFTNTLIILSDTLSKAESSKDYSIANNVGSRNDYYNYTKLEGKEFSFVSGERSMLYIFEAQYTENTPRLTFLQTAYVCNNSQAYFITLALPTTIKTFEKYEKMLSTFICE